MQRADTRADTGADIFLSRPPQELISPWRKNREYLQKNVKIKKVDLFLHFLSESNQNRTENTAEKIEISIFLHRVSPYKMASASNFERHDVTTMSRGAQRFREQKDQRNDQSMPLCVLRLIKSLNLVIVN